jgi:hypothetical protein
LEVHWLLIAAENVSPVIGNHLVASLGWTLGEAFCCLICQNAESKARKPSRKFVGYRCKIRIN